MLLSQRPDPKEKQVIILDQDVQVCEYFWWMMYELLFMNHLSPFFFGHGLSLFFFLFLNTWTFMCPTLFFYYLDLHVSNSLFLNMPFEHVAYLLWVCILYFFFFCIAHILDGNFGERESHGMTWSFILWWMEMLAIF